MVKLMLLCLIYSLPGPPKIVLDTGTYQLYPINKRLCSEFDPFRDTIFELYTRDNLSNSEILRIGDDTLLKKSRINFEKPTVIFFHGFLESSKAEDSVKIKDNFLRSGDYNVILVNNERLLAGPDYITASLNVDPIGHYTANFVDYLVEKGLKLSDLHIIGMSLGAQIAGVIGKNIKSGKVSWITGLDPAGPFFDYKSTNNRLSKGDAEFVDVIHSNSGLFGTLYSSGDVDIWFNGGHFQPGCDPVSVAKRKPTIAELVFCNHYQAWRLYVETLINPEAYLAVKCKHHESFNRNECDENEKTYVGLNVDKGAKGNYFIETGVTAVNI